MDTKHYIHWDSVFKGLSRIDESNKTVFGVPRGGLCASAFLKRATITHDPAKADIILDDIVDSGKTRDFYKASYPDTDFHALVDKTNGDDNLGWVVFPWEGEKDTDDIVVRLLQYIGEDPTRGGLLETPQRALKAWEHWTSGYIKDPASLLKVFEDGAEGCDQMVIVEDIPIWSQCEHHLAPFFGKATIGYIPRNKIVGLSKFARLADAFARRLQVQERLTNQIADCLWETLDPLGVGVILKCRHLCMESRGVSTQGSSTLTSALRGNFRDEQEVRGEFLKLKNKL